MTAPKTTVDWLNFRNQGEVLQTLEAVRPLFGKHGFLLNLAHLPRGKDGFQQACSLRIADMVVGRLDFGGASQRGWVRTNVTGQGCEWIEDWEALEAVEALPKAEIKRLDLALTTWSGEVSHDRVEKAYEAGLFSSGGRPPNLQRILNSDPRAGETCYVGQRKDSDKFFRGYEKGFELASKMGTLGKTLTHIRGVGADGDPVMYRVEDIYRCEVELKAASRPIPWEVIGRRDQYFAGSYPFLAQLLPEAECDILMRCPDRAPQMDLMAALANCRVQYGATLHTALKALGGDYMAVWDKVCGDHDNEALLAAGVLLVDHA